MHEVALMEEILTILRENAQTQGFCHVHRVILSIGKLSGIEPENLAFCFKSVTAGSLAQGAELEIQEVPGLGWCEPCGRSVEMETPFDPCPHCGAAQLPVTAGMDLRLEGIDVE